MGVRFVPPSQSYSGFVFFQGSDCGAQVCIHFGLHAHARCHPEGGCYRR